jgi:hypothetical protein
VPGPVTCPLEVPIEVPPQAANRYFEYCLRVAYFLMRKDWPDWCNWAKMQLGEYARLMWEAIRLSHFLESGSRKFVYRMNRVERVASWTYRFDEPLYVMTYGSRIWWASRALSVELGKWVYTKGDQWCGAGGNYIPGRGTWGPVEAGPGCCGRFFEEKRVFLADVILDQWAHLNSWMWHEQKEEKDHVYLLQKSSVDFIGMLSELDKDRYVLRSGFFDRYSVV